MWALWDRNLIFRHAVRPHSTACKAPLQVHNSRTLQRLKKKQKQSEQCRLWAKNYRGMWVSVDTELFVLNGRLQLNWISVDPITPAMFPVCHACIIKKKCPSIFLVRGQRLRIHTPLSMHHACCSRLTLVTVTQHPYTAIKVMHMCIQHFPKENQKHKMNTKQEQTNDDIK